MSVFQIAYVTRTRAQIPGSSVSSDRGHRVSGTILVRHPFRFHFIEGEPAELSEWFRRDCADQRNDLCKCVLFRPVKERMFDGLEASRIDDDVVGSVPRPIDLWAALNLEEATCTTEQTNQVRDALKWFVGDADSS